MKPCPSFPGYFATADGAVWSRRRRRQPLLLAQTTTRKGYRTIAVCVGVRMRPVGVHQLVADAFRGARPSKAHQVRHLDGNPSNNCASNLAWGTATENAADRLRHGHYERGARHHNAKLTEEGVLSILKMRDLRTPVRIIAQQFRVSIATVEGIIYGKTWKHVSFKRAEQEATR